MVSGKLSLVSPRPVVRAKHSWHVTWLTLVAALSLALPGWAWAAELWHSASGSPLPRESEIRWLWPYLARTWPRLLLFEQGVGVSREQGITQASPGITLRHAGAEAVALSWQISGAKLRGPAQQRSRLVSL